MCSLPEQVIIKVWKWWEIEQVAIVKKVRKTDLGGRQLISELKATLLRKYNSRKKKTKPNKKIWLYESSFSWAEFILKVNLWEI